MSIAGNNQAAVNNKHLQGSWNAIHSGDFPFLGPHFCWLLGLWKCRPALLAALYPWPKIFNHNCQFCYFLASPCLSPCKFPNLSLRPKNVLCVMECWSVQVILPIEVPVSKLGECPVGWVKISEWAAKSAQCPVLSMLHNRMVFMICAVGMWDFEWWLEQVETRRLVPCKGTKIGRKNGIWNPYPQHINLWSLQRFLTIVFF